MQWANEGPLVRLATGIEPLDRLCRGGLPVPWRVFIVGAPSAGKTAVETIIAGNLARAANAAGACIGILAVDEEPEDITVRLAQIAGFTVHDVEARDPRVMARVAEALSTLRARLYDGRWTIDAAASDLAIWCKSESRPGVLFVDSVQAARSIESLAGTSPREMVEANIRAMRVASAMHRLLTIGTVEANRGTYRTEQTDQNDLAAGAESRAFEFGAQTQLVLRTPKGHPDIIHVHVVKNRRASKDEFWLRLDREHHTVEECDKPTGAAPEPDEEQAHAKRLAKEHAAARGLIKVLLGKPGLGARDVRVAGSQARLGGNETIEAAMLLLRTEGLDGYQLVNRGTESRPKWFAERCLNLGGDSAQV